MSAFFKFNKNDILHSTLNASHKVSVSYDGTKWVGNLGPSGSLSMFGGIRSKEKANTPGISVEPIRRIPAYTIDGELYVTGSYPFSGSISLVRMRNYEFTYSDTEWGEEHFSPVLNLYDYYSNIDADFVTGSYDFYTLFFNKNSGNRVSRIINTGSLTENLLNTVTSSFTFELLVKPFSTASVGSRYYLISEAETKGNRNYIFSLYIDGSNSSKLTLDIVSGSVVTSSVGVQSNVWQHIAVTRDSSGTGSFYIDMKQVGTFLENQTIDNNIVSVGLSTNYHDLIIGNDATSLTSSFHGFISEVKIWNSEQTYLQLSSSHNSVLFSSSSQGNLTLYDRLNSGPILGASSSIDHSQNSKNGTLSSFTTPVWHPSDNRNFVTSKNLINNTVSVLRAFHIPSLFYGRQIATGSVTIIDKTHEGSGLIRVYNDDGRGGLYISGSVVSASIDEKENYKGVFWNKIGNVFYSEGLIVIKDPSLIDIGDVANSAYELSFNGIERTPSNVFMCRANAAEINASNNKTYSVLDNTTGKYHVIRDNPTTYITSVGLYNEEMKLVAVAKLAQPIRKREKDNINIRLKMDF